jgi:predicted DNA-binding protein
MLETKMNTNTFEQVLHATERLPIDEQLLLVERLIENIRHKQKTSSGDIEEELLEDLEDIIAADQVRKKINSGEEETYSLQQVKQHLGL